METITVRFSLGGREAEALKRLAYAELRSPRDQARYLLRKELEERGLLQEREGTDQEHGGEVATCQS